MWMNGLTATEVTNIALKNKDKNFIKFIIQNREEYELPGWNILELAKATGDSNYIKKIIRKREAYGIELGLISILDFMGIKDIENVIKEREEYGINDVEACEIISYIEHSKGNVASLLKNADRVICVKYRKEFMGGNSIEYFLNKIAKIEGTNEEEVEKFYEITDSDVIEAKIRKIVNNKEKYKLSAEDLCKFINYDIRVCENLDLISLLREAGEEVTRKYRQLFMNTEFLRANFKEIAEIEGFKSEIIDEMLKTNKDAMLRTDFRIFRENIVEIFGKDKMFQIAYYPNTASKFAELNENKLHVIKKCMDFFLEKTRGEEWNVIVQRILNNINGYDELIENISNVENIDIEKLTKILIDTNSYKLKTVEDFENYAEIKKQECDKLIKQNDIMVKKQAILLKIFGQSLEDSKRMLESFGKDANTIQDEDLKSYIECLREIFNVSDEDTLHEIYNEIDEIENTNPIIMERLLKNEFGKLYNEGLFNIEDGEKIGENLYKAGTEFKMLITSVAPYTPHEVKNYYDDWNRTSMMSQHFCTSYIRNDMIGTSPIPNICYGFNKMSDDALVLSGKRDIGSFSKQIIPIALERNEFLSPDNLINATERYNELDYKRIQDGERKQPDYIVVFSKDGVIENLEQAQKASKEFGELPIVIVDVTACLNSEREKVQDLVEQLNEDHSEETLKQIQQKIRNNRVTDSNFASDINISMLSTIVNNKGKKCLQTIAEDTQVEGIQAENMQVKRAQLEDTQTKETDGIEDYGEKNSEMKSVYSQIKTVVEKGNEDYER